jgi:D-3-phosphoglycerate dehydrogenase
MQVNDYDIEMAPARYMLFFAYEDRPGVIGRVGTILGEANINIATMDVGRSSSGGTALMGLTLDSPVPTEVTERIANEIGAYDTPIFIVLAD